jgi:UDP-N-acetylmuramoyl-L-alanyl-D-glutamate--2,6-diaminopimelate ligase
MTAPRTSDRVQHASLALIASKLDCATIVGDSAVCVGGVQHDSRKVTDGDLFVARKGDKVDGLAFVADAVARGAVAVMAGRDHAPQACAVPVLLVGDIRTAIGQAALVVYGDPSAQMPVIGITGTNGKTTTSYMMQALIDRTGGRAGVLGTLGAHFEGLDLASGHTTPEADEVVRIAARMSRAGASHMVMEVSSHALAQARVDAMHFQVAAYTNLTRDHLDFHGTMEAYAQAKTRLFFDLHPASAALMIDDDFGRSLASRLSIPLVRVSRRPDSAADIRPLSGVEHDARGIRCKVATPAGSVDLQSTLVGEHNLSNLLLALGIGSALGTDMSVAAAALSSPIVVPGRLERCDSPGDDLVVLADYAHTPDAIEHALGAIRPLTTGKVHCVFGCGGDRDRTKRPMMGEVVGRLADVAIVTNDNPRGEPPVAIVREILSGMQQSSAEVLVEPERDCAIELAILSAQPGDVVLLAGKGHEPYQILGAITRHFDDREQARQALAVRRANRARRAP